MPYRVIVTDPDGDVFHTCAESLANRESAGMSALRFLSRRNVRFGIAGMSFGRQVRDVPLGETVTHESGYVFRTEEV
jgi:hypothetical protein